MILCNKNIRNVVMKSKKLIFSILTILIIFYSFMIEPNRLIVKNVTVKDSELAGMRVVLVGDYHIEPNQRKRLKRLVNLINEQNADLVLSVGDFVAGCEQDTTMPIEDIVKELKEVKSKNGFYTVLGNHDCWIDRVGITKELNENGIRVLSNSNIKVNIKGKELYIAGLEDLATGSPNISQAIDKTKRPVILLTHSPDVFPYVPQSVNITLAGHVHGGQVRLPLFGVLYVPSAYGNRYSQGLIIENGKKMYVTKGIGNSTLSVRFNCVPEINVIDFES